MLSSQCSPVRQQSSKHIWLWSQQTSQNPFLHICPLDRGQNTDFPPCWPLDAGETTPPSTSLLCHLRTKLTTASFLSLLHGRKAHGLLEGRGWEAWRVSEIQSCRGEVTQAESKVQQHCGGREAQRGTMAHRVLGREPAPHTCDAGRHSQSLREGSGCGHFLGGSQQRM